MSNVNYDTGLFINYVLSFLLKKIVVPSDFHSQVSVIKEMLRDDVSGLVDSLTDFAVNVSSVNFSIETDNESFTAILKEWLEKVNIDYQGQIPTGINPLAEEYFKERWKYSSFPILKLTEWGVINGIVLPMKMFFVDGESVYAEDKNEDDEEIKLINYDYYLGAESKEPLSKAIITKPYGRWFDKYPTPYLVKRGVYHNWKIIQSIKNKESEILDQIIPYLLLVKKGTESLATNNVKTYSNEELQGVVQQFQDLMDKIKDTNIDDKLNKTPIRATQFDEEIKHLIPDLAGIFEPKLFAQAEKNILAGLGFIDVAEAVTTSRRESILNPKAFIEESKKGVKDFKQILKEIVLKIKEKNSNHKKYLNAQFYIISDPIRGFMTDDFKEKLRQLYDRGLLSKQTAVELIGETEFETETYRRTSETEKGYDIDMYPPVTDNREGQGTDIPGEGLGDTDEDDLPDDKTDEIEKKEYDMGAKFSCECIKCGKKVSSDKHCKDFRCPKCGGQMRRTDRPGTGRPDKSPNAKGELEGAPYQTIKDLPPGVKDHMSPNLQRTFMRVFNKALDQYKNETRAFRVAWSVIKKIAKKGKGGKWVRKSSKSKITKAMLEEILEQEEAQVIDQIIEEKKKELDEAVEAKKLEIAQKQSALLDKLLGTKNKENHEDIQG